MRSILPTLGYRPSSLAEVETASETRGAGLSEWPGLVLFLLGRDCRRDEILAVMERVRSLPSLALMVRGEAAWDADLIKRCCDCAHWPCPLDELSYRLGRLSPIQTGARASALSREMSDTLARLNLIGRSAAFLEAMNHLQRVVRCDASVLIEGETGTGKELVARAIHYLGGRASGPFVPINCGALPDHLVENELFGHDRGAYTDAKGAVPGAIGEAAGGTLFLDEVEALSAKAQATLLRFLQDHEYRPLGAARARRSDARVVAASNSGLRALAEQGAFRADLFFRLEVLSLVLPPLRERGDDLEVLAHHFIERYRREYGLAPLTLDRRSLPALRAYQWPGNVRELENVIHRAVLMADGASLLVRPVAGGNLVGSGPAAMRDPNAFGCADPALRPVDVDLDEGFAAAKARAIAAFEHRYLTELMQATGGNVTQAARRADKERRALGKLLKKYAIVLPATRGDGRSDSGTMP